MLTAYGIVAYNFKGKKFFYNSILVLVMIPMQLSIIGFYQYMAKIGLDDNYAVVDLAKYCFGRSSVLLQAVP